MATHLGLPVVHPPCRALPVASSRHARLCLTCHRSLHDPLCHASDFLLVVSHLQFCLALSSISLFQPSILLVPLSISPVPVPIALSYSTPVCFAQLLIDRHLLPHVSLSLSTRLGIHTSQWMAMRLGRINRYSVVQRACRTITGSSPCHHPSSSSPWPHVAPPHPLPLIEH